VGNRRLSVALTYQLFFVETNGSHTLPLKPKHSITGAPAQVKPRAQEGYEIPPPTPPLARRTVPGSDEGTATAADGDGGVKGGTGLRP
jgi:hypothetical protein